MTIRGIEERQLSAEARSRLVCLLSARLLVVGLGLTWSLFSCGANHSERRPNSARAAEAAVSSGAAFGSTSVSDPTRHQEVALRIVAFNDFHGNLLPVEEGPRPLGGAVGLAAYIRHAQTGFEGRSLLIHAGDAVGASPPESGLLQDEPTIAFLNLLANGACDWPRHDDPSCDMVGTLGNHEFDEGVPEMLRLLFGGRPPGAFLGDEQRGVRFPYVSANVVYRASGKPLLPRYVIRRVGGVNVGVVGAVLRDTPGILSPVAPGMASIGFESEASAVNQAVSELVSMGVRVVILTVHQGLDQTSYEGPTRRDIPVSGALLPIVAALHDEIDVIVSGHTHAFTNAYVSNDTGAEFLVTQALSGARALATIDLLVVRETGEVVRKAAAVRKTYLDVPPGNRPQPDVQRLVQATVSKVRPQTERQVGVALDDVLRHTQGEDSPLGNLVADAQRSAGNGDFALTNPGGIRAELPKGPVTWGQLFAIQPFGNRLIRVSMTGEQLRELLERQRQRTGETRFFQISGFTYEWHEAQPVGARVRALSKIDGSPIRSDTTYRVVLNDYLVGGGDEVSGLSQLPQVPIADTDVDALVRYFQHHPDGVEPPALGRIKRGH